MRSKPDWLAGSAVAIAAAGIFAWMSTGLASDSTSSQLLRGRYLVYAGDCAACHTADGGAPFAGGRAVPTPFGTIYATNITPDRDTGIGRWTDEQFFDAMHDGVRPDGSHLYPAFPYPWYTKLRRDDVLAIKAYLDTLKPARNDVKKPELPWPMSWRGSVAIWNALFLRRGEYVRDKNKSDEWNRGAYLVEGLGHCGACHSPKNLLGGVKKDQRFRGGMGEGWFATSLTTQAHEGLGGWSVDEIVEYLKTGANERARAYGPMAEVVQHSTAHLSDADLRAIAIYLKDLPSGGDQAPERASADHEALFRGERIYIDQCAACHMENGEGVRGVFPPLRGNTSVHAHDPQSLVRLVLEGAPSVKTHDKPEGFAMPGFADKLSDADVADLITYVRSSFGNQASPVTAAKVSKVRREERQS